jgi:hypothetical protein
MASNMTRVSIPYAAMIGTNDPVEANAGIMVTAGAPVSVYALDFDSFASTAFPYTVTTSNETFTVTTNAGQFFDVGADGPVAIHANKPIQVAQFAYGSSFDHG